MLPGILHMGPTPKFHTTCGLDMKKAGPKCPRLCNTSNGRRIYYTRPTGSTEEAPSQTSVSRRESHPGEFLVSLICI